MVGIEEEEGLDLLFVREEVEVEVEVEGVADAAAALLGGIAVWTMLSYP